MINKITQKFPDIKIFESLDDSLRTNFDGYIIATPANTHYEIAKKIINAGFHLLVEKPFCLNLDEAKELVEHAKDKAVKIMVGHVLLFHPAIIKIKEIIVVKLKKVNMTDMEHFYYLGKNIQVHGEKENHGI